MINHETIILSSETLKELACIVSDIGIIEMQQKVLQDKRELGIISIGDALIEYDNLSKKEIALREKYVMKVHVKLDGEPRRITFHEATEANPVAYWYTIMADGHRRKCSTREKLINLLYDHYTGKLADNSIRAIFKAAIHEKEITENPKKNSIDRHKAHFKRLISDDFALKDIREVTSTYLKEYTQKWVNTDHPKKALYLAYKGILNMIFDYAMMHGIITVNPVKTINNKVYLKSCDLSRSNPEEKILSPEEIQRLRETVRRRMTMNKYGRYYINGYALLFAIETGVRVGELCSLKWEDVRENRIHIHTQQLYEKNEKGRKTYYLVPYTKNEKGISTEGRDFPLTDAIEEILVELRKLQDEMGIRSEYIFCHEDGEWIKTDAYLTFLRRLCKSLEYKVTNNHALRMSLNSNVLIPLGISVADRAAMLGHSVETNLKFYSYAQKGYIEDVRNLLNTAFSRPETPRDTSGTPKIVDFPQIEKAQNH